MHKWFYCSGLDLSNTDICRYAAIYAEQPPEAADVLQSSISEQSPDASTSLPEQELFVTKSRMQVGTSRGHNCKAAHQVNVYWVVLTCMSAPCVVQKNRM